MDQARSGGQPLQDLLLDQRKQWCALQQSGNVGRIGRIEQR